MNVEEAVKNCEIYLKQIKRYDPDPYYVNYFLNRYLISIERIKDQILEEANEDFGLFISDGVSEQKFYEKAKLKKDKNAIEFSEWYFLKQIEKHKNPYPNFMKKTSLFKNKFNKLPEIKIMIRASDRYKDDINQQIKVNINQKKYVQKKR